MLSLAEVFGGILVFEVVELSQAEKEVCLRGRRTRIRKCHFAEVLFYDGSLRLECRRPRLLAFTSPGSRAVFLCLPFAEQTFRNVGYSLKIEEAFTGEKNGVTLEAMICLFEKPLTNPEPTAECQGGAG